MSAPIGFVGAGVMGTHLVRRLLEADNSLLVFARTPAKVEGLVEAGATCTTDLAELNERCDIVVGCLLDDEAVSSVYLAGRQPSSHADIDRRPSARGLVSRSRPGQIFIEHGTFSPRLARNLAHIATQRGAHFIDAPVTGGPEGAAAGTLVIMAGTDHPAAVESVRHLVENYAREVHLTGPAGSGEQLKLVNQLLVSVHMAVVAEAAALVTRSGIAPDVASAVLGSGWAASAMLKRELPLALSGDFTNRGASIVGLIHVQQMVATAFADAGIDPLLLPVARELFERAVNEGYGDSDPAALVQLYPTDRLPQHTAPTLSAPTGATL